MAKQDGVPGESTTEDKSKKAADEQAVRPAATGETEVKNAHASGVGSMERTDGATPPEERD